MEAWEPMPFGVLVAREASDQVHVYLRFGAVDFADIVSDRRFTIERRERPRLRRRRASGSRLTLRLRPGDRIRVLETVSLEEVLVYVWDVETDPDGVVVHPPRRLFHN